VVGTLAAARKALRDVRSSIGDMATAQNLEHYERYWKHFLDALKKAENKVRAQLKDVTGFRGWIGQWEGRRKADPLLAYCLHARNSDGHWIKEITAAEGRMTIKAGKEGSSHIRRILITPTKRQVQYTGGAPELKFVHRLRLLPVEDGGQTYDPPPAAQGEHPTPPHELAEQAASMIEALIQDAERRFLP
jgi:hypothetical protein